MSKIEECAALEEMAQDQDNELQKEGRQELASYLNFLYATWKNAGFPSQSIFDGLMQAVHDELRK